MTRPETLPDDLAALRALVLTAWAERDAERAEKGRLIEERDQLAGQNDRLRHLLRQLQRMQFGQRSEKLDPDQFNLGWKTSNRRSLPAKPNRRRPIRRCAKPVRRSGAPDADRCRSTCRGSKSSSNRKTPPARAAAARCM